MFFTLSSRNLRYIANVIGCLAYTYTSSVDMKEVGETNKFERGRIKPRTMRREEK